MKNLKRILIIGSDSEIGSYTLNKYKKLGVKVDGTSKRNNINENDKIKFDLLDKKFPFDFDDYDKCLICAGINKIDYCNKNPLQARNVNVLSIIRLIEECKKNNIYVTYLSSVSVFDGTRSFYQVNDKPIPFTKYGKFKLEVEKFIINNYLEKSSILRLSKVISPDTPIIKKWLNEYAAGKPIYAYRDKFIAPVSIKDVFLKLNILLSAKKSGIYHLSGKNDISFFDFSKNFFNKKEIFDVEIKPINFFQGKKTFKGKYSSLSNSFID